MFSYVRTYCLRMCVCVCVCVCVFESEREKLRLEVVDKVHDPLPLSLLELITFPISDALSVLCKRQRRVRGLDNLTAAGKAAVWPLRPQRTSSEPQICEINPKHWMEDTFKQGDNTWFINLPDRLSRSSAAVWVHSYLITEQEEWKRKAFVFMHYSWEEDYVKIE